MIATKPTLMTHTVLPKMRFLMTFIQINNTVYNLLGWNNKFEHIRSILGENSPKIWDWVKGCVLMKADIFWLASVPVFPCPLQSLVLGLPYCRDMNEHLQAESLTPEQPPHGTMQNLEGHRHVNVESSTHVRKVQSLMQKHNGVKKNCPTTFRSLPYILYLPKDHRSPPV